MNYPLISEYIEAIKSSEDNFEELSYLSPVLDDDGLPVMTSGNFAVVFKMKDEQSGKFYAVKCFTKEQEGRAEAYREIAKELKDVSSPYLVSIQYLEKELFVDTDQSAETEFPVLLMDWVEGKTLDKYLRENLDDKYALEMLAYRFSLLAQWLIPQPFAHGDLKPDNILVREDGSLVLVDYDGIYVPAMKGQKARELGSPDFRHPLRTEDDFDENIDVFPILSILTSLKAISLNSELLETYGAPDRLLLSEKDYRNIDTSAFIKYYFPAKNEDINILYALLIIATSIESKTISKYLITLLHSTFCAPSRVKVLFNNEELTMVFVKGGTYIMGSQSENPSLPNYAVEAQKEDGPVRKVKVNDFWISETLVPMEMWPNCTEDRYYDEIAWERRKGKVIDERFGAYGASYEDCEKFIVTLSKKTNLQFDFPTEEEWEFAAKGGRKSTGYKYAGSDDINEVAQYGTGIDGGLCALKQKKPNEIGIYDMSGSLFEWCKGVVDLESVKGIDKAIIESYCKKKHPFPEIKMRILRGGSISSSANKCRVTYRKFDIICRSGIYDETYQDVKVSSIVAESTILDEAFKREYEESFYWEDYHSEQTGLRLVLRNLTPPQEEHTTIVLKEDFEKTFVDEYGVVYSLDKTRLLRGPIEQVTKGNHGWTKGTIKGYYSVRPGTVCICDRAFCNCPNLETIVLPQSVRQIGKYAFNNCLNLSCVNLNDGLAKIDDNAFSGCKHLHSIHLPDSVKFVGNNPFMGCMINVVFSNNEG